MKIAIKNDRTIASFVLGGILALGLVSTGAVHASEPEPRPMLPGDRPAEGELEGFLGEPFFRKDVLFGSGRMPHILIAADGTVLASGAGQFRRSEDGGESWTNHESPLRNSMVVDETTGDVLAVDLGSVAEGAIVWRSRDHGKTWNREEAALKPNDVMRWLQQRMGLRDAGGHRWRVEKGPIVRGPGSARWQGWGKYVLGIGVNETGITLRHGENKGRLLIPQWFALSNAGRGERATYHACAIYSDDGGATWTVSGLFPETWTNESALVELQDGRVFFTARKNYYEDDVFEHNRPFAWSYDGGESFDDLALSNVLPDGPRYRGTERRGANYQTHFGMLGGLVRLPVTGRDILLYSNADTPSHERIRMTVWASFDGGATWPIKRLVYEGPSAYSSLAAGRPGTPSEGKAYLLFEGGPDGMYSAIQLARFNLSWLLEGERTGDGEMPAEKE